LFTCIPLSENLKATDGRPKRKMTKKRNLKMQWQQREGPNAKGRRNET